MLLQCNLINLVEVKKATSIGIVDYFA